MDQIITDPGISSYVPEYVPNDIPPSFLNCEESFELLMSTIGKIENNLFQENNYQNFIELTHSEIESKLNNKRPAQSRASKQHKSRAKAYWNSELQNCGIVLLSQNSSGLSLKVQLGLGINCVKGTAL